LEIIVAGFTSIFSEKTRKERRTFMIMRMDFLETGMDIYVNED